MRVSWSVIGSGRAKSSTSSASTARKSRSHEKCAVPVQMRPEVWLVHPDGMLLDFPHESPGPHRFLTLRLGLAIEPEPVRSLRS